MPPLLARLGCVSPAKIPRKWIHSGQIWATTNAQETSRKVYRARVNTLLLGADRRLLSPRADALESYLMTKLSDAKFYNTYRAMAFMRVIRFSLERHLFELAIALYDRMLKEGLLAVHSLSLRMAALKIAQKMTKFTETVSTLKELFENRAYDVPAFMDLVRYLADEKHAPGALIDDLAHVFVSMRQIELSEYPELVGMLASTNMRADRLDGAQKWLQVFEDTCGTQGVLPDVAPYSIIISTLNDMDPKNGDAIQDVLVRMKSAGVAPDVNIFNALIRVNFVQQRYQEAFALYRVLMEKRSEELMPNDVTYKMLFRANNLLSHPRIARRHKRPENAVSPRRLFREMLECHLDRTNSRPLERSTVISVSAFHLALRTFMAREDYAAAYIVIHSLHVFGFQPNLQSYLIVFASLLHRMKRETDIHRPDDNHRLADFLTHLRPREDPDIQTLVERIRCDQPPFKRTGPSTIGIETMSHLLDLGEPTRPTNSDLPSVSTLPRALTKKSPPRIPTVAMLTGTEDPADERALFSPIPLARIVHRALLGELFRKAVNRPADWDWKGAVGPIVEETGREMVPEGKGVVRPPDVEKRAGVLPFAAARMRRRKRGARGGREVAFDYES